jgi:hypothetical protein
MSKVLHLLRFDPLSPSLKDEMRVLVFRPILRRVKLFEIKAKVPVAFVDALAMRITALPFSPGDTIVARGMYGNALCIVLTGQVVTTRSGVQRRLIASDDRQPIFGVSATLDDRAFQAAQDEFSQWSVESVSFSDVAQIEHNAFALALEAAWPEGESIMRRVAREEVLRSDGIKMTNALGDKVRSTVWVGNVPSRWATESRLRQLLARFGTIRSATVRQKKGKNKSWALVTFQDVVSAQKALKDNIDV